MKMNSFESDMKRAICNVNFIIALVVECGILCCAGWESELFRVSVPVLSPFPYSTAWLNEYQSGFVKEYVVRCGRRSYIWGKLLACGISGGVLLVLAGFFAQCTGIEPKGNLFLLFFSGMFWAVVSAALAVAANSRYVAYGGSFVLCYLLVILYQRYFQALYCLYPVEWYAPEHTWVFGDTGILMMVCGLILVVGIFYDGMVRRCVENV